MRGETLVSPTSAGAGRSLDWVWPDPAVDNANGVTGIVSRNGQQRTINSGNSGTGALNGFQLDGETCQMLRCFAAADWHMQMLDSAANVNWRALAGPSAARDTSCWRFEVVCLPTGFPVSNTTNDVGVYFLRSNGTYAQIFKDGGDGFGFRFKDAATCEFVARGPNGLQRFSIAVDNSTHLHKMEMRLIGATATADAVLKLFIDDVPIAAPDPRFVSWSAGTHLPVPFWSGGRTQAFAPIMLNQSGLAVDNSLFVKEARISAAPTEANLL